MIRNLLWFVGAAWVGSFLTLAMVALFGKGRRAPRPAAVEAEGRSSSELKTAVGKEIMGH